MTLLVGWAALDDKKVGKTIASIYFASDSRYTYLSNGDAMYYNDKGQKVFGCKNSPEIFAFCGEVNGPKHIIQSVIDKIDGGKIDGYDSDNSSKVHLICGCIKDLLCSYQITHTVTCDFALYHGTRYQNTFHVFKYQYNKNSKLLSCDELLMPNVYSDLIFSDGSGRDDFNKNWYEKYNNDYRKNNINFRTSRAVYHCVQNTLAITEDETVGKIPQIIGLYRKFNARCYGVIHDGKRFTIGASGVEEIDDNKLAEISDEIEWRNECFEIVEPSTRQRKKDAQIQPSI